MRIGIDLGGTTVKAALCAEDGTLLLRDSLPTQTGNAAGLKADMKALALSLCRAHGCAVEDVTTIGIGVPGSFDKATCTLRFGTNLGLNTSALRMRFCRSSAARCIWITTPTAPRSAKRLPVRPRARATC